MPKLWLVLALIGLTLPTAAYSQQGNVPFAPNGYPDLSKSDMGAHDTATMPSNLDIIRNGIRSNDMDRTAQAVRERLGPSRPAKTKELAAGALVNDNTGAAMATIVTVAPDGIVVATATGKVKVPAGAFGHNNAGLLLDMTKADFDKIVVKANGSS